MEDSVTSKLLAGSFRDRLKANHEMFLSESQEFVSKIGIQPHWNVLDVGAGTGLMIEELSKVLTTGSLTALEPHDDFEGDLRALSNKNPEKVFFIKSSIEDANYPCSKNPEGYDLIFIKHVLHHCAADGALKILANFLKPGGKLAIAEFAHGTNSFWGSGVYCENLSILANAAAKFMRVHSTKDNGASYISPILIKNSISPLFDIDYFKNFSPIVHPKSEWGEMNYVITVNHARRYIDAGFCTEENLTKAKEEFAIIAEQPESAVVCMMQIEIVATKK